MIRYLRKNGGLAFLLVSILIRFIFSLSSELFETVYFNGLFPIIRWLQYGFGELLPIPGYYLLFCILIGWLVWRVPKNRKLEQWKRFLLRSLNFIGFWTSLFLLLWGYNYVGPSLSDRLGLSENSASYDVAKIYLYAMTEADKDRERISLPHDSASVDELELDIDYKAINEAVKNSIGQLGYPIAEQVSLKRIKPRGTLRRLGIRGIYNPFTGEANVESDSGIITATFTAAHEMAHAYGITSEGEANFVAYMALKSTNEEIWNYAASYSLWRYTAREVNEQLNQDQLAILAESIPLGLQIDRRAIWRRASSSPAYFPELSEAMNDTYLKVQGVEKGVEDYNSFVSLYLSYYRPVTD